MVVVRLRLDLRAAVALLRLQDTQVAKDDDATTFSLSFGFFRFATTSTRSPGIERAGEQLVRVTGDLQRPLRARELRRGCPAPSAARTASGSAARPRRRARSGRGS